MKNLIYRALFVILILGSLSSEVSAAANRLFTRENAAQVGSGWDGVLRVQQQAAAGSSTPGIISMWGGARETIVLRSDGSVWTWGINDCMYGTGICGKLGDGTNVEKHHPTRVHGAGNMGYLDSVTAIMGGEHDNYAIKSDMTVWAWGGNFAGQLGDGTYINSVTPVQVSGLTSVTALGGRGYHNLAMKSNGTVWAWGWNSRGQLGHDTSSSPCPTPLTGTCSNVPVQVLGLANPLAVTGGGFFSLALMPDHTLQAWGANEYGQLGDGTYTDRPGPVAVSSILSGVTQVSGGWKHAAALTSAGKVWTWGNNVEGEIGNGVTSTSGMNLPYQVPGLSNILAVSAGDRFTAVLKDDGTVWTWGWNGFGQLGTGSYEDAYSPVQVQGLSDVIAIAARDYHMLALKQDGTLWAWGSGENGELGNNEVSNKNVPVQVFFPDKIMLLPLVMKMP